jgi:hypothetical protein
MLHSTGPSSPTNTSRLKALPLVVLLLCAAPLAHADDESRVLMTVAGGRMSDLGWGGEIGLDVGLGKNTDFHGPAMRASFFAGRDGAKGTIGLLAQGIDDEDLLGYLTTAGVSLAVSRAWGPNERSALFVGPEVQISFAHAITVNAGFQFPVGRRGGNSGRATIGLTMGLPVMFHKS